MSGWTNSELVLCALIKQSGAEATNCRDLSSSERRSTAQPKYFLLRVAEDPIFRSNIERNTVARVAALVQPFKESSCCRKRQYTDDCVKHPYRSLETKGIDSGSFDDLEY